MPEITVLDNRQTPCAVGLIRADEAAATLKPGTPLQILTRDRFAQVEIPLWAERAGHSKPTISRAGFWPLRHFVFSLVTGESK
ncbi:MAG: sulfurtransferase TusA family protein [Cryobacterium sp.]|nr:sulfurtransferase TusA family protein [Cryobacterium sp.]